MGSAAARYRPSRYPLPSFPRKRESRTVLRQTRLLPIGHFWIPACAGRTVEGAGMTVGGQPGIAVERQSRLSGLSNSLVESPFPAPFLSRCLRL